MPCRQSRSSCGWQVEGWLLLVSGSTSNLWSFLCIKSCPGWASLSPELEASSLPSSPHGVEGEGGITRERSEGDSSKPQHKAVPALQMGFRHLQGSGESSTCCFSFPRGAQKCAVSRYKSERGSIPAGHWPNLRQCAASPLPQPHTTASTPCSSAGSAMPLGPGMPQIVLGLGSRSVSPSWQHGANTSWASASTAGSGP